MTKNLYIQVVFRIALIIANSFAIWYFYSSNFTITFLAFLVLIVIQILLLLQLIKHQFTDVEKTVDCLLHDDFSISISKEKRKTRLYNKTALLINKNKQTAFQKASEQLIFTNIIESLSIGILILRRDTEDEIEVFQLNDIFVQFLKIPKYYKWDILKTKIQPLLNVVDELQWKTIKHVISIAIDEETEETFHLKTSVTKTYNYEYLIISLETIQQLIDKKEKESWYKLMNVMSHEIINTITPISSLAENLESLVDDDIASNEENLEELSKGLKIIKKRSQHLNTFVDTYRKLAELPLPNFGTIDLVLLVKNVLSLFEQEFANKGILIAFKNEEETFVNADKQQIEQVLINLLSNSVYALTETKEPQITLSISKQDKRIFLTIADNGIGIPDEIKHNIFVPYFTTRKNGSGIGLTLAKSIMEAHHGNIQLKVERDSTVFKLSFVE